MKELFKEQLEYANPLTEEILQVMEKKRYCSGENKQAGDIILYGFKVEFENEEMTLTLFDLCERDFNFYSEQYTTQKSPFPGSMEIPIFILKGDEEKYNTILNKDLKK